MMKKTTGKRVLSMILVLALCCSMLSFPAAAEEPTEQPAEEVSVSVQENEGQQPEETAMQPEPEPTEPEPGEPEVTEPAEESENTVPVETEGGGAEGTEEPAEPEAETDV